MARRPNSATVDPTGEVPRTGTSRPVETTDQLRPTGIDDGVGDPEFEHAFMLAPVGLAVFDPTGCVRSVNSRFADMVDRPGVDVTGLHFGRLVHVDDRDELQAAFDQLRRRGGPDRAMVAVRLMTVPHGPTAPEPSSVSCELALRAFRSDGICRWTVGRLDSIEWRQQLEAAQVAGERRVQSLVDNMPDPVMRLGLDGAVLFTNAAAARFRLAEEAMAGIAGEHRLTRAQRDTLRSAFVGAVHQGRPAQVEFDIGSGEAVRHFVGDLVPETRAGEGVCSVLVTWRDLTVQRRHHGALTYAATHDSLTGLANRAAFITALDTLLGDVHHTPAVLFLDLDRFKIVNDSLGHDVGDELLVVFSDRIRSVLRDDDVLARFGGDEFAVLLADADVVVARQVADRLQLATGVPAVVAGYQLTINASVGIVIAEEPGLTSAEVLRRADAAMYRAKELGRSRIHLFDEALQRRIEDRLETEQSLRLAIARDELVMHYQPEVDLQTGRILGVEALLRWNHPARGLLSAAVFCPAAEETGEIVAIGVWALERACTEVMAWPVMGSAAPPGEFVLRVNASARQFEHPSFVGEVERILTSTGFPPGRLCLELTETALMRHPDQALDVLGELAGLGVSLAIDDFGTGYSSLSYLKRFPVDVLKIDRSFVLGVGDDAEDMAIVRSVIQLGEALSMVVTAEGVEDERQRRTLVQLGCRRGQGYLFARPCPGGDAVRLPWSDGFGPLDPGS